MNKIFVHQTVVGAYGFVWRERKDFLLLSFPFIAALSILSSLLVSSAMPLQGEGISQAPISVSGVGIVFGLVSMICVVLFSVAWHRRYLLPQESLTVISTLKWSRRQTRFLLVGILLGIIVTGIVSLGVLAQMVVGGGVGAGSGTPAAIFVIATLIAGFIVYARLSLILPAITVDNTLTFQNCWNLTKGNGWRLLIIIVLGSLPVWLTGMLLSLLANSIFSGWGIGESLTAGLILNLIDQTIAFIAVAVGVSVLSISYQRLSGAGTVITRANS